MRRINTPSESGTYTLVRRDWFVNDRMHDPLGQLIVDRNLTADKQRDVPRALQRYPAFGRRGEPCWRLEVDSSRSRVQTKQKLKKLQRTRWAFACASGASWHPLFSALVDKSRKKVVATEGWGCTLARDRYMCWISGLAYSWTHIAGCTGWTRLLMVPEEELPECWLERACLPGGATLAQCPQGKP